MRLTLAYDFDFKDLYSRPGLTRIDERFCAFIEEQDVGLYNRLLTARRNGFATKLEESDFIVSLAPFLERFIALLFRIEKETSGLQKTHNRLGPIYECKRQFVQRRAARKYKPEEAAVFEGAKLHQDLEKLFNAEFSTILFAEKTLAWMQDEASHAKELETAEKYAAWALYADNGRRHHKKDTLFKQPKKTEPGNLVPLEHEVCNGYRLLKLPNEDYVSRNGFSLTDSGGNLEFALDQANYCIWCHKQGKDSCSTGLRERAPKPDGKIPFQKSSHGISLAGCPLDEKISEMNMIKAAGHAIGSLAAAMIDNPLCAMTGHRICNDCMKSCIYQKQEPVDIPQIETRTLKDVLHLPWGFEIYSLLTRWNPLNVERPLPRPETMRKILVAGAGPAGINLSHHLLNDGHYVCLIDGLKIEPLPIAFEPIFDAAMLWEDLNIRTMAGFGGVAEYGITVRWDKNFLKIVRLLLQRRELFDLFGGIRFGGTVTAEQAFAIGFDHVALCLGAGRPTILDVPGNLAKGVRAASDFLMGLQLTGAAKQDSIANLQVRLPAVIIGGGLTAIDTATEVLAYYPVQVEKFLSRFEHLAKQKGEAAIRDLWTSEERDIAEEFFAHARELRAERARQKPDIIGLLQKWGGATIAYRRSLTDAPSYTLNHEEVHKAMEEGIFFAPNLTPLEIKTDALGHAQSIVFANEESAKIELPARAVLVAAGTQPNTVLAREDAALNLKIDGKYFQAYDLDGHPVTPERSAKPEQTHIFMHQRQDGRKISFFGDLHPSFSGNVVKAMASAKAGYPLIRAHLESLPQSDIDIATLRAELRGGFDVSVHEVNRLTPTIVEVVIKAPYAALNFEPGQFYRLQNFESFAGIANGTRLTMEGLAMTGAWVDKERGLLGIIALEMGGSSNLCASLRPGDKIVLMGPTGTPTEIIAGEKVILVGGGLGNAVLFSIGKALRAAGSEVVYFAGYKNPSDRFKPAEIEAASDCVVWCSDVGPAFTPSRPKDRSFIGNIVAAMEHHNDLVHGADRIICIGSDRMMAAVAKAKHSVLQAYLPQTSIAVGSINSPMQCMMKEICAQCIQRHIDPVTGKEEIVFSCFNQDQDMDRVDWNCLNDRLAQNKTQEKLTAAWINQGLKA